MGWACRAATHSQGKARSAAAAADTAGLNLWGKGGSEGAYARTENHVGFGSRAAGQKLDSMGVTPAAAAAAGWRTFVGLLCEAAYSSY
jgi:hypothetical protein